MVPLPRGVVKIPMTFSVVSNRPLSYEEKCKRALEELAHLADTIRRPGETPNNVWQSKQEEMEHHLALAVKSAQFASTKRPFRMTGAGSSVEAVRVIM